MTISRLHLSWTKLHANKRGTICHCKADTQARIGLWEIKVETRTAKRNKHPKTKRGLGIDTLFPCKWERTKTMPETKDMHPKTIRYFKSALIIRKGMNPGANSSGAMLRWKSGGSINNTERTDKIVVVTALLPKLFLSFTGLLKANLSL